jgi:hypothetical protein
MIPKLENIRKESKRGTRRERIDGNKIIGKAQKEGENGQRERYRE